MFDTRIATTQQVTGGCHVTKGLSPLSAAEIDELQGCIDEMYKKAEKTGIENRYAVVVITTHERLLAMAKRCLEYDLQNPQ